MRIPRRLFKHPLSDSRLLLLKARIFHRPQELLDLNEVAGRLPLGNRHLLGRRDVAIDQIIGTEGRTQDFDREFHPFFERIRDRWVRVADLYKPQSLFKRIA